MKKTYRAAKIRANSFDEDTNTIQVVWTTGAAVRRADYNGDSTTRFCRSIPAL